VWLAASRRCTALPLCPSGREPLLLLLKVKPSIADIFYFLSAAIILAWMNLMMYLMQRLALMKIKRILWLT